MTTAPDLPLAAKRIVVTRAPEQAEAIAHELHRFGAEVISLPVVSFAAPEDSAPLDRALGELARFDWVLFTSQNAVRFVSSRLGQLGLKNVARHVAALGPATAEVARQEGFRVNYVAANHTSHGLASELQGSLKGQRVLFPRSGRSNDHIAIALRESGADVTDVVAYRTVAPETPDQVILDQIRTGSVDVIIFASPSAFDNLAYFLGLSELVKLAETVQFAAIGPTTAKAMRESGVRVHIEAIETSAAGLSDAIVKHYQDRAIPPRHG
jgi:uroporphyrinogen III methyltransferase / synthase